MSFLRTLSNTAQTILKTVDVAATKTTTLINVVGNTVDEVDRWAENTYALNGASREANRKESIKELVQDVHVRRAESQANLLNLIESDEKFAECFKESASEFKTMEEELLAKYG